MKVIHSNEKFLKFLKSHFQIWDILVSHNFCSLISPWQNDENEHMSWFFNNLCEELSNVLSRFWLDMIYLFKLCFDDLFIMFQIITTLGKHLYFGHVSQTCGNCCWHLFIKLRKIQFKYLKHNFEHIKFAGNINVKTWKG